MKSNMLPDNYRLATQCFDARSSSGNACTMIARGAHATELFFDNDRGYEEGQTLVLNIYLPGSRSPIAAMVRVDRIKKMTGKDRGKITASVSILGLNVHAQKSILDCVILENLSKSMSGATA